MSLTLAFDVYGTLIDAHGVVVRLETLIGSRAREFSRIWREKQLEYSFRRGLMRRYQNFGLCTRQALDYTSSLLGVELSEEQKSALMAEYRVLPVFEDVEESLQTLQEAGHALFAFSNGTADAVGALLENAGIRSRFDGVVSVDDRQTFKPNPDVYRHFVETTGATVADTWLISSNSFDVIGAVSYGMRAAWVQRSKDSVFDPWGIEPTLRINSLRELAQGIAAEHA